MQKIEALYDYVYLTVDKEREDTIESKVGSLYLANKFEHGEYNRIYGTVVSVPKALSSAPMNYDREPIGYPPPKDFRHNFVTLSDIDPVVQVGDKIYFHFNTIEEDNRVKQHFADLSSKIFKVRYDNIICLVRDGEIQMVSGWVLVDKVFDPDIQEVELDGHKVKARTTKSGIITEVGVKPKSLIGTIRYIGSPFKCDEDLGVYPGDQIVFSKESDWVNKIEGHEYYVMRQRDIIAKYEEV